MIDLEQHYSDCARRFLQTAIVIDDQAHFGPTITTVVSQVPTPTGSVLQPAQQASEAAVAVTLEQSLPQPQAGSLNAKVLTHAFMAKDMICGLYRPEAGEAMVERTTGAAKLADVVVVDWYLEPGSSRAAKDIVKQLLSSDRAEQGRLRLIAIYTSQSGRAAIAKELLTEIEAEAGLQGFLRQEGAALVGIDTRIIVLNKRNTPPGDDLEQVNEEALPDRLIEEFAYLSRGLLASFALSSISAVRRGAHHVLALYTGDLDGAFVGHRIGIPNPDDSKAFAIDMLTSELRNLVELEDVADRTLGSDVVEAWVQSRIGAGHHFRTGAAEIAAADVLAFVKGGASAVKASGPRHHVHGNAAEPVDEQLRVSTAKVSRIFYNDAATAQTGARGLARLTTFQREPGRIRIPENWRPQLTLGTLIQEDQAVPNAAAAPVFLCVQPRCDSNRLTARTWFPMQAVIMDDPHFNIVLQDKAMAIREAWVSLKPMDTRIVEFDPDNAKQIVLAEREDDRFLFTDSAGKRWVWLGDLKEMKAQRWAIDLGSRILGVGMDELELLRLASERKLKANWAG